MHRPSGGAPCLRGSPPGRGQFNLDRPAGNYTQCPSKAPSISHARLLEIAGFRGAIPARAPRPAARRNHGDRAAHVLLDREPGTERKCKARKHVARNTGRCTFAPGAMPALVAHRLREARAIARIAERRDTLHAIGLARRPGGHRARNDRAVEPRGSPPMRKKRRPLVSEQRPAPRALTEGDRAGGCVWC
jgi:hypothetical protein